MNGLGGYFRDVLVVYAHDINYLHTAFLACLLSKLILHRTFCLPLSLSVIFLSDVEICRLL
jgi:hypothetical protein